MANRIIRDWTDSEKIESLSWKGEVFFTRLIMKADDFGRYHANPKLLKASIFPLKDIDTQEIEELLKECEQADLLVTYESAGKKYLQISNFNQRLRIMRSKFPEMSANGQQSASEGMPETETKQETNPKQKEKEREGIVIYSDSDFLKETMNTQWLDEICMGLKIDPGWGDEKLKEFATDQKMKNAYGRALGEMKRHFYSWLKIQIEKNVKQSNSNKSTNSGSKESRKASVDALVAATERMYSKDNGNQ